MVSMVAPLSTGVSGWCTGLTGGARVGRGTVSYTPVTKDFWVDEPGGGFIKRAS